MTKIIAAGVLGAVTVFGAAGAVPAQATASQVTQDCRTYSGVKVCGEVQLTEQQKQCVQQAVQKGMSDRRAEVECSR
ncbi:hypothetical protein [Actinomadura rudentiformis]|uniref:DUF3551 domain-containing protein n=1 Tax=Actinomadura rudentiformis TaxID=359158 RepID=A0A6H9Z6X7_9ACTN|nr:hypothetical protein [Actinomadura rudentiformis]KAB2351849.1 hypothetical protein F8566_06480 [Actinomadura rudentiformis]